MNYQVIIETIEKVIHNSNFTVEKRERYDKSLNKIRSRTKDSNIYLGVVGEFSSGKSTLINALIGADFFVTNAVQGTTTVVTKLAYSNNINLVLKYKNGQILSYKKDKSKLMELYLPMTYSGMSSIDKFIMKFKGVFGFNRYDEYFPEVFDVVTTSNEISVELDEVVVYYPSQILKDGLVIVDTPGTDSLVPEHNVITQRAIREICDLALVVVPAITPLSMTLVDFLDENLRDNIDKCCFVITKTELLKRAIERTHLINGVTKRIEQLLGVNNPVVISAPTLVSLEYRNIIEKVGVLKHLSNDEKKCLSDDFLSNVSQMKEDIQKNKENTINAKIRQLVKVLGIDLSSELTNMMKQLEDELMQTQLLRAKPLVEFMNDFYKLNEIYSLSYIEAKISNTVSRECGDFKKYVNRKINNAESKDEAQDTMNNDATRKYGTGCFDNCYEVFSNILDETKESFETNFKEFKEQFTNSYGIESVDFIYEMNNNPSWKRKFNFSYDKTNLTTFAVLRFFKSLESVKQQMIDDVNPKIDRAFKKIESYYLKKAKCAYFELSKQMEKIKKIFIKKYQKVINKRIVESDKKEKILYAKIDHLTKQMNDLKTIDAI